MKNETPDQVGCDGYTSLPAPTGNLNDSLFKHCTCNLHETGDICSLDIIDISVCLGSIFHASLVDVAHYLMEFLVNLCRAPAYVHRILCHFKA